METMVMGGYICNISKKSGRIDTCKHGQPMNLGLLLILVVV